MKRIISWVLSLMLILANLPVHGQDFMSDSLKNVIVSGKTDSAKASAYLELARHQFNDFRKDDTALIILKSMLSFVRQKGLAKQEAICLGRTGVYYFSGSFGKQNFKKGYQLNLEAIAVARKHHLRSTEIDLMIDLIVMLNNKQLGNKADSVKLVLEQALQQSFQYQLVEQQIKALAGKGRYYASLNKDSAKKYYLQALAISRKSNLPNSEVDLLRAMANSYSINHWGDSANSLMQEAINVARTNHFVDKELNLLGPRISSESGFFVKDSFFTNYERLHVLSRENKMDSLRFMSAFAQSCTDMGNFPKALQTLFIVLHACEEKKDSAEIEATLNKIGHTYYETKDYKRALEYLNKSNQYGAINPFYQIFSHIDLAQTWLKLHQNDSASFYAGKSYKLAVEFYGSESNVFGGVLNDLGSLYNVLGKDSLAIDYLRRSYVYFTTRNIQYLNYCSSTIGLAKYFQKKTMADSSFIYAKLCLATAKDKGFLPYLSESSSIITEYFHKKQLVDSAYYYQQIGFEAYKSLYNDENGRQIQNMVFAEQQREADIAAAKKIAADQYASQLRNYGMVSVAIFVLIIGIIVSRNNRRKQKSIDLLSKQKQEIDSQKSKLELSFNELRATQSQLIQSEKMASLGELTAGIAHEIQNPLNFVNNFSEVNTELIDELTVEAEKGNIAEIKAIAKDIKENEEKINHHGKRADAIVKGMLQHSRASNSTKEPTNINALTDEYLRLAYHGLRAKDKSFNATMVTDYDASIGNINIIPQDIGRVVLNLISNAFYAVDEKKKQQPEGYEPTVTIRTKKITNPSGNSQVSISVADNGNGIPQKIIDKIFQPFFTTKPTGEGTGLGLSLSYDIVKAHGGELKLETVIGEGAVFAILLPVS